jgi:hypothetical protein
MSGVAKVLGGMFALALFACGSQQDPFPLLEQEVIGRPDALSATEWSAYMKNTEYLFGLTKPGVSVQLNLADQRQYDFYLARLKLVGQDADNSPYLFSLIDERRRDHLARGLKPGTFVQDRSPAMVNDPTIQSKHFIAQKSATRVTNQADVKATGGSTVLGGSDMTQIDVQVHYSNGSPVTPLVVKQQITDENGVVGGNVPVSTSRKIALTSAKQFRVTSVETTEIDGQFSTKFVQESFGSTNPTVAFAPPALTSGVTEPEATNALPNDRIDICIDRGGPGICDHRIDTGDPYQGRIRIPFAGSVSIDPSSAITFDPARFANIKWAFSQDPPLDPGGDVGSINLVLTNDGGACGVEGVGFNLGMGQFWKFAELTNGNKTLTWNNTGNENSLFFGQGCYRVQEEAQLVVKIPLTYLLGTDTTNDSFTVTTDPSVSRPNIKLDSLTITNSCLAEGTLIQLSSGKFAPIENLQVGQTVFNPYDKKDHALVIRDVISGTESEPMLRIRDEHGNTLRLTEKHPIATPDRGMVQARHLKPGDIVMTAKGASTLREVHRESYTGKVYNLQLGSEPELAELGHDQTIVYANGFVVGDNQIQSKYDILSMRQENSRSVDQIPERWRRDYMLSPLR